MKKFPWNEEIYLAQQGDTAAVRRICATAEPVVNQFGKVSYFTNLLGNDEVRSIASLALIEFIMSYRGGVSDEEIPALIMQALKCDLLNSVHRLEYRRSKEVPFQADRAADAVRNTNDDTVFPFAPPDGEPETCLVHKAYTQKVQEAIQQLNRNQQTVIRSYYFRQETTNEIAAALGCSPQFVRKIRRKALLRLRGLLDNTAVISRREDGI